MTQDYLAPDINNACQVVLMAKNLPANAGVGKLQQWILGRRRCEVISSIVLKNEAQDVEEGVRESLVGKVTFARRLLHGVRKSQALQAAQEHVKHNYPSDSQNKVSIPQVHYSTQLHLCDGDSLQEKGGKKSGN
ncbi:unnamed protein product [Rangifer tarandus platyrhynchus]|uniref:Uncharacterized protein n=1 Tax=Rangifer tarandus platyrhynchus TaxID=3082113 RepID=A0AC59YAF5_RANTA